MRPDASLAAKAGWTPAPPATPVAATAQWLGQQFERWAQGLGADATTARIAAAAGQALAHADELAQICWPVPDQLGFDKLLASGLVAHARAVRVGTAVPCPMVLDEQKRLYLWRRFAQQHRLALAVRARAGALEPRAHESAALARLQELFGPASRARADAEQWQACVMALRQRLLVISGGPGTGKTTTVVRLLAALLAQQAGCRIALAAPTGKAAARIQEALQQRTTDLQPHELAALPTQTFTVHRLVGLRPDGTARHHAHNPLPWDVVVVDEASMLDLSLADHLLDALAPTTRLVLLGDKDQLASVEAGSVFADLSRRAALDEPTQTWLASLGATPQTSQHAPPTQDTPPPLVNQVAWLTHSRRFAADSGIGQLAAWVRDGPHQVMPSGMRALTLGQPHGESPPPWPDVQWLPGPTQDSPAHLQAAYDGYAPMLTAALEWLAAMHEAPPSTTTTTTTAEPAQASTMPLGPDAAYAAYLRFRVLCAHRHGAHSVAAFNQGLDAWARRTLPAVTGPQGQAWVLGQPLLVSHNDVELNVFNGDTGLLGPAPAAWGASRPSCALWLPRSGRDGVSVWRTVPLHRLDHLQSAWALTVHQSQGSEFDTVFLQLPPPGRDGQASPVLNREWLYTGVTRAKARLVLAADPRAVQAAAGQASHRHSGLSDEWAVPPPR
jgi:exodeoxyribonuclease V alpha subunit